MFLQISLLLIVFHGRICRQGCDRGGHKQVKSSNWRHLTWLIITCQVIWGAHLDWLVSQVTWQLLDLINRFSIAWGILGKSLISWCRSSRRYYLTNLAIFHVDAEVSGVLQVRLSLWIDLPSTLSIHYRPSHNFWGFGDGRPEVSGGSRIRWGLCGSRASAGGRLIRVAVVDSSVNQV